MNDTLMPMINASIFELRENFRGVTEVFIHWDHWFFFLAVFLLGACVGSYLNVVIYRLPLGMSTNKPKRSFCPLCKKQIPYFRNIPLLTWILQRGKCAECAAPIPVRYFLVELFTALLWVLCWWFFAVYKEIPQGVEMWYPAALAVFFMIIATVFLVITVIDIDHMLIPAPLTTIGIITGLLGAAILPQHIGYASWNAGLWNAGWGAVMGFCGLWLVVLLGKIAFGKKKIALDEPLAWHIRDAKEGDENDDISFVLDGEDNFWYDLFFRKSDKMILSGVSELKVNDKPYDLDELEIQREVLYLGEEQLGIEKLKSISGKVSSLVIPREAMGMGDVHLLGMIGAVFGWQCLLFVILAASVCGIILHVVCKAGWGKPLPFGPSLIAGAIIWLATGSDIVDWYIAWMRGTLG